MFIRKERFGFLTYDPIDKKPIIIEDDSLPDDIKEFCEVIENSNEYFPFLSAPIAFYVYPSMSCNKNCSYCYFKNQINKTPLVMSDSVIDKVVELTKKHGVFTVNILGGEPLMAGTWEAVKRLLEELLPLDVAVNLTTNGIEFIEYYSCIESLKLKYPELFSLNLSFNSGDENQVYSEKLLNTLDKIAKNGPEINLNTIVISHDISDYTKIIDLLNRNDQIKCLNLLYPRLKGPPLPSAHVEFCQEFVRLFGAQKINIETPFAHVYNDSGIDDETFGQFHYGCGLGKRTLSVAPNGDVFACSKLIKGDGFCVGNIFEGLLPLWNRAFEIRQASDLKLIAKGCKDKCRYYGICESCLADKIEGVDLFCEFAV